MGKSGDFVLTFIGEPLELGDKRIASFLEAIEVAAGETIDCAVSGSSYFPKKIVGDRISYINQWLEEPNQFGVPATLTNGLNDSMLLITIDNRLSEQISAQCGVPSGPYISFFQVQAYEELGHLPVFAKAFPKLAVELNAYWGVLRSAIFDEQIVHTKAYYQKSLKNVTHPKELELLEKDKHKYIYDIERPQLLGVGPKGERFSAVLQWMNYWSDPMASSLQFPDPVLDKAWEGLYERVDDAGWLLKLTDEPTNLDNSEHLEQVHRIFKRFKIQSVDVTSS